MKKIKFEFKKPDGYIFHGGDLVLSYLNYFTLYVNLQYWPHAQPTHVLVKCWGGKKWSFVLLKFHFQWLNNIAKWKQAGGFVKSSSKGIDDPLWWQEVNICSVTSSQQLPGCGSHKGPGDGAVAPGPFSFNPSAVGQIMYFTSHF